MQWRPFEGLARSPLVLVLLGAYWAFVDCSIEALRVPRFAGVRVFHCLPFDAGSSAQISNLEFSAFCPLLQGTKEDGTSRKNGLSRASAERDPRVLPQGLEEGGMELRRIWPSYVWRV